MRNLVTAVTFMLLLFAAMARGAGAADERPHWSLELKGGAFFPQTPRWSQFYGESYLWEYGAALAYKVHRMLEVGIEGSYARGTGKGQQSNHGQGGGSGIVQQGKLIFQHVPLNLFVLGRLVQRESQLLVPYAGVGYTRMFFREEVSGQEKRDGSVDGFHARAGIQVLLDRLEPQSAGELYQEVGLRHTYLFVEGKYTRAMARQVGSGSVNIGGPSCLGGMLFEF